jgi:hypothetical protein
MNRLGTIRRIIEGTEWPKPYAWVLIDGDDEQDMLDVQLGMLRPAPSEPRPSHALDDVDAIIDDLNMESLRPRLDALVEKVRLEVIEACAVAARGPIRDPGSIGAELKEEAAARVRALTTDGSGHAGNEQKGKDR